MWFSLDTWRSETQKFFLSIYIAKKKKKFWHIKREANWYFSRGLCFCKKGKSLSQYNSQENGIADWAGTNHVNIKIKKWAWIGKQPETYLPQKFVILFSLWLISVEKHRCSLHLPCSHSPLSFIYQLNHQS